MSSGPRPVATTATIAPIAPSASAGSSRRGPPVPPAWRPVRSPGLLPLAIALWLLVSLLLWRWMPGGRSDDAEILLHTQTWAWGWRLRNPPLFEWLAGALMTLTGPHAWAVMSLRVACMAAFMAGLHRVARALGASRSEAAVAALAPLWVLQFSYYALFDLTHTVLAGVFYVAVVAAVHHAVARPGAARMALLGLAVGLGLLTKHFFAFYAAAAALACALHAPYRVVWRPRHLLVVAAVALLVVAPYWLWMAQQGPQLWAQQTRESLRVGLAGAGGWQDGPWRIPFLVAVVSLPWALLYGLLSLGRGPRRPAVQPLAARWILTTLVLTLLLVAAVWIMQGARRFEAHHLYFLILLPLAATLGLPRRDDGGRRMRVAVWVSLAWLAVMLAGLVLDHHRTARRCTTCGPYIDYAALGRSIRAAGLDAGTLYFASHTRQLSVPALRPYLQARLVRLDVPSTESPTDAPLPAGQRCAVIWQPGRDGWLQDAGLIQRLPPGLRAAAATGTPTWQGAAPLIVPGRSGQLLALAVAAQGCR